MSESACHRDRSLRLSLQFGFFLIGIITVLLGQILPFISVRQTLTDAAAGTLFLAQFSGSIVGTLVSGVFIRRFGFVLPIIAGLILIVSGLPGLLASSFLITCAALFVLGAGLGLSIPSTNLFVVAISPLREASNLNVINLCWGLGAICSQPFASIFIRLEVFSWAVFGLCLGLMLVGAFLVRYGPERTFELTTVGDQGASNHIWNQPLAWVVAAFNFVNIGIESSLGGWLTTYSTRLVAEGRFFVNVTVIFFMCMVIGRGVASKAPFRMSENRILMFCTLLLFLGVVLIVISWHPLVSLAGAALSGLGTSAIFPTNLARFQRLFGPSAKHKATPLFIAGTAGAAVISSVVGQVSTRYADLRSGILIILLAGFMLVVLQTILHFGFLSRGRGRTTRSEH